MKNLWVRQSGQSLPEFAVGMVVLVPLFLGVSTIGKLADTNTSIVQGARYQAWEMAVVPNTGKSVLDLDKEAMNRAMTADGVLIRTGDPLLTDAGYQKPLWRAHGSADDKPFRYVANSESGSQTAMQVKSTPDHPASGTIQQGFGELADLLQTSVAGVLELETDTLYKATFNVDVRKDAFLGENGAAAGCETASTSVFMCASRTSAIFADTWSAANPQNVRNHTDNLVPMKLLAPVGEFIAKFQEASSAFTDFDPVAELGKLEDAPGFVAADVVPEDRLGQYKEEDRLQ
ncbi:hypothetical protein [Allohahella sp. A8]|uniref:hypothetical protein n=1 Tax=Allohahella sp. A8 TaxID=3141461 RepID=UPI003A802D1D